MKKILLALILTMVFVLSLTICVSAADENSKVDPQTKSPCEMILGDVNGDGEVTNADVLMIYRYIYNPELYPLPTICVHKFGDDSYYETTVVSATCSGEGYTLYKCKYCGFEYCDEFTEKTDHTFGDWKEMLSFCTARIMMRSCTECDYSTINIENGDWHKYTSSVVKPTCTNEGYTLHKCETCNLEYRDEFTEKTDHTFGDWEEMTSSCTTKFSMCSCTECGYSTFRTENGDWHKYTVTVVKPTCSARGYTLYSCSNCNISYEENYVDATEEHTWKELYVITSTCVEKKTVAMCTDCNITQIIEGTPTEEHDYVVTVVPPTIEEQGYTEHTCKICGDNFKDSFVPVIGSVGLEFTSNDDGTCYVSGIGTCTDTDIVIPSRSPKGDRVTSIGYSALHDCDSITSVTIPDSVTSIDEWAFYACDSLTSITFGENSELTSIGNHAFTWCSLTSIIIPDSVINIGTYAFNSCTALESVTIGDNVTGIGERTFENCTSLTSVTFGDNVINIGIYAFNGCTMLESITFGENSELTSIGNYAFQDCDSLMSVTFGENSKLTSIGHSAFLGCTSLTNITIPDSVISIGSYAFDGCDSLMSVTFGENSELTSIGDRAFYSCESLTSIIIPDSVTNIGKLAFEDCDNLASVTFGENSELTSIGEWAFSSCESLTSITIPDNVTSIGNQAFSNCYKLVEVINKSSLSITAGSDANGYVAYYAKEVHSGDSKIVDKDGFLFYTYNGVNYLLGYKGNETELTMPDNYNGQNYKIHEYAFYNCDSLTSITIGDSVTSIGSNAFDRCDSFTSINIPDSVTSIDYGAFYACKSLASVTFGENSELTKIDHWAFYNCISLASITIPDSVTSIGGMAFLQCDSLKDVYYTGTQEQWKKISIGNYNEDLTSATIHYNYVAS